MRHAETISTDRLVKLKALTDAQREAAEKRLLEAVRADKHKLVVLDDDPTGVQTVHDVSVYTDWSLESIRSGFAEEKKLFYILTNSRGFTAEQTTRAHREIAERVCAVSKETGIPFVLISRSDSTLRGHYPLETSILREVIEEKTGVKIDGEVLCPFFLEGGRYTIGNVHYVKYGDTLVPAGETEFAKDQTFGYRASDLRDYVEEKTGGAYCADDVIAVSIDELRAGTPEDVTKKLLAAHDFQKIIVNAAAYVDVKLFAAAFYGALSQGKNYLLRTAASLVKELGGISDQPLLTRAQMVVRETTNGGVIVVGSHTKKTTMQLEELKKADGIACVEFDSDLVLDDGAFQKETARARKEIEQIILSGKTAVAYTRRTLLIVENDTPEDALVRSVKISGAVQSLVGELSVTPAFVIAKGGITSSDVGTKALRVKRARVMGQIAPGIPVWQTGAESKFPQTPYVIFPGNVGEEKTLREAAEILMGKA